MSISVRDECPHCGFELAKNDNGDGPAVLLIFILGFSLVPLAWLVQMIFAPPLWVHAIIWTTVVLGLTIGALRPVKALVIALQYKHRGHTWENEKK